MNTNNTKLVYVGSVLSAIILDPVSTLGVSFTTVEKTLERCPRQGLIIRYASPSGTSCVAAVTPNGAMTVAAQNFLADLDERVGPKGIGWVDELMSGRTVQHTPVRRTHLDNTLDYLERQEQDISWMRESLVTHYGTLSA